MNGDEQLHWRKGTKSIPTARTRTTMAAENTTVHSSQPKEIQQYQANGGLRKSPGPGGSAACSRDAVPSRGGSVLHEEDQDSASCRTDSAYILLQLRDMRRTSSTPDRITDSRGVCKNSSPDGTRVSSTSSSGAEVAGGGKSSEIKISNGSISQMTMAPAAVGVSQGYHHPQSRPPMHPSEGNTDRFGVSTVSSSSSSQGYGSRPAVGVMGAAAVAAVAAVERGMYVPGLLPGFQGGVSQPTAASAVAAAAAAAAASSQLPTPMPRPVTSTPGPGGSAALRPICPKRAPEGVMVVSPTTGQLVPVSSLVWQFALAILLRCSSR